MIALISPHFNYWAAAIVLMIGLYGIIGKKNVVKKIIGLAIFQTAIILFYVSIGAKTGGNIPILDHHGHYEAPVAHQFDDFETETEAAPIPPVELVDLIDEAAAPSESAHAPEIDPNQYDNPLPHVLMLTAIVVGVATLGLALALAQRIYATFGTLEEDEILAQLEKQGEHD